MKKKIIMSRLKPLCRFNYLQRPKLVFQNESKISPNSKVETLRHFGGRDCLCKLAVAVTSWISISLLTPNPTTRRLFHFLRINNWIAALKKNNKIHKIHQNQWLQHCTCSVTILNHWLPDWKKVRKKVRKIN
jgi:hypothetical protein